MAEEVTDPGLLAILNGTPTAPTSKKMPRDVARVLANATSPSLPPSGPQTWRGQPAESVGIHPPSLSPVATASAAEITDPALLSQLNAPPAGTPSSSPEGILEDVAGAVPSLGTGILRGGLSTAMMPFDVMNMTRRALGQQPQFPGTEEVGDFMKDTTGMSLYEPQSRLQRDVSAAGAMLPALVSKNPQAILAALGGGAAGQELSQELPRSPWIADAPWSRALGNVGGMVATAAALHPKLAAKTAVQVIPGGKTAWTSTAENLNELVRALGEGGQKAARPPGLPARDITFLPPTSKAGQVEDLAGALLRPKVPFDLPQQAQNLMHTDAWPYLKAVWRALGIPEIQYQADQQPSMQPPR